MFCKTCLVLVLASAMAFAQQSPQQKEDPTRKYVPITVEDLLKLKTSASPSPQSSTNELNDRLHALAMSASSAQDYLLGPGDTITVSVYDVPGLGNTDLTLDAKGNILLPFLDEVNLLGLTARESRVKIAALYEVSHLNNPQVTVTVKSYRSQPVSVLGAVGKPGSYPLSGPTRLLDILFMVGGISDRANPTAVIRRPVWRAETSGKADGSTGGQAATGVRGTEQAPGAGLPISYGSIEIDLTQLLTKGDMSLNIPILGGDIIAIPERPQQFVFVLGDVKGGGAFEIKKNEQLTLQRALALSGGFLPTSKPTKAVIIREGKEAGQSFQIPVNAKEILSGKQKDVVLQASDIVLVPGSVSKTIGRNVFMSMTGLVSSAILYGLIYK